MQSASWTTAKSLEIASNFDIVRQNKNSTIQISYAIYQVISAIQTRFLLKPYDLRFCLPQHMHIGWKTSHRNIFLKGNDRSELCRILSEQLFICNLWLNYATTNPHHSFELARSFLIRILGKTMHFLWRIVLRYPAILSWKSSWFIPNAQSKIASPSQTKPLSRDVWDVYVRNHRTIG